MISPSSAARLATQLECLPALLEGAAPAALDGRTRSGKWSVRENLAHLARHHQVMLDRVRKVLAEDRPRLPRYAAEEDAEWPAWAALPLDEVRGRLTALRTELTAMVCALDDKQLGRTAVHPTLGEMALPLWIEFFLLHEAHHLYVVMKRARGGE
ncbi:MAG TPA: DinB family protein [Vicinamibacteria bacterium]|nr:DinB family protein [Vicinamibacteria bacterium]